MCANGVPNIGAEAAENFEKTVLFDPKVDILGQKPTILTKLGATSSF